MICAMNMIKMQPVKINDNQREGLAKVADNLATAIAVAVIAGGIVEKRIGLLSTCILCCFAVVLLFVAFNLRNDKGEENGN